MSKNLAKTPAQLLAELDELSKKSKEQEEKLKAANQKLEASNEDLISKEKALKESKNNYIITLENLQVGVVVHNSDGSVLLSNPKASQLLGLTHEQMQGKELIDPSWNFVNEDLSIIEVEDYPVARVIATKQSIDSYQIGIKTKDRDYINWGIVNAKPVFLDNELDKIIVNFIDITERKQAEDEIRLLNKELEQRVKERTAQLKVNNEQLQASEERFNLAMKASNDGLFDWNLETNEIYYSPSWKKLIGYEDHEIPNDFSVWENTTAPEDVKKSWEQQQKLISKQIDHFVIEFKMKHKDGHWVDILSRAKAIFNDEGKAIRVVGTHTDITERKQAANKLKATNQQLRTSKQQLEASNKEIIGKERLLSSIFNTVGDVLFLIDVEAENKFRFNYINKSFLLATGLSKSDVEGKLIEEVIPEPSFQMVRENYLKSIKEKKLIRWEETSEYPAGVKTGIVSIIPIIDENGNCRQLVGSVTDITERKKVEDALKESEERFRIVFNNANDIMYIVEVTKEKGPVVVDANKAAFELLGYTRDELIGMPMTELDGEESKAKIPERVKRIMSGEKCTFESLQLKKDGSAFPIEVSASLIKIAGKTYIYSVNRDITERKQAEEKIIQQNEFLNNVLESLTYPFYIIDINDYSVLQANSASGLNFDLNKITCHALTHNSDIPCSSQDHPCPIEIVKKTRKSTMVEHIHFDADGNRRNVEVYCYPIFDKNGDIISAIEYSLDITERKQAEAELLKLSTAVKQSPSVITITDTDGNIEYVNPKFTELTDFSLEEVIGQNSRLLKSGEQSDEFYKELWETISSGKTWRGEFHNKKKDGELFWEMAFVSPILNAEGKIINYLKVAEDITEQKRNEQIQKVIYNISNAVITSESLEDFIKQIQKELGVLMDTKNFFVALYDEPSDTITLPYFQDEKDNIVTFPAEKTLTGWVIKNGKTLLIDDKKAIELEKKGVIDKVGADSKIWLGVPLKNKGKAIGAFVLQSYENPNAYTEKDKEVLEFISTQISISLERKKEEIELKKAKEKAEESDRLKTAFLHNMSHEIRTPLNGITGFIGLLQESEIDDDKRQKYYDIINKSSDRLITTVTDIIDVSRIEAGEVKVSKSEVSVNKILNEQYNFFYHQAKSKGVELIYKPFLSDKKVHFVTDKHKLEGILTNLIKNAIKFTDQGEITFACLLKKEQDIDVLEFYVKDTGIGIPANRIDSIFNSFEQADIEDKRAHQGSGLGLAIVKSYVEMLGGKISVKSIEGEGSTFTFSLPYTKRLVKEGGATQNKEEESGVSLKNLSIIVADDEKTSRMFFDAILKNQVKSIIYATNGKETIEKFRENPDTDIILMDIKMPDMNGYDVTRVIRIYNKDVVIIAQTAFGLSGDREKAIEAGCNDYISKPIIKGILFEKIRACLDKKSI